MSNPQALKLFSDMLGYKKQGEQIQASADRQERSVQAQFDRMSLMADKQRNAQNLSEGKSFALKTGVGTPETWSAYMNNPEIQTQADLLVKNGLPTVKKGEQQDPNLVALRDIALRRGQDQEIHNQSIIRPNNRELEGLLKDMNAGKTDKSMGMMRVNELLKANSDQTGKRQIMLVTGDRVPGVGKIKGWINNHKIVAIDAQTGQTLADIQDADGNLSDNPIKSLEKFTNQASTPAITQQDVDANRAGLANASDKEITELQIARPDMYQILLPDIQRRQQAIAMSKGKK